MKWTKQDWINIILLTTLNIIRKLIYIKKWPVGADTFHFLKSCVDHTGSGLFIYDICNFVNVIGLKWIMFIIGLLIIPLFYLFARMILQHRLFANYTTMLLIVTPTFFFWTQWNFIDKNIPAFFWLIVIYMIVLSRDLKEKWQIPLLFIACAGLIYAWDGGWFGCLLGLVIMIIKYWKKYKYYILLFGIITLILFSQKFIHLVKFIFSTERFLIAEMMSPLLLPLTFERILFLLSPLILIFISEIRLRYNKHLILLFLINYMAYIINYRFFIHIIPLFLVLLGLTLTIKSHKYGQKKIANIFLVLMITQLSFAIPAMHHKGEMSDSMVPIFEFINELPNECLVSVWDKGHMFHYYTNKQIMYKASAGRYKEQLDIFINGKDTDCIIVFNQDDLESIETMAKYDKITTPIIDYKIFDKETNNKLIEGYMIQWH